MIAFSSSPGSPQTARDNVDYIPRSILLQWHVTEQCGGHCLHCYQDALPVNNELDLVLLNRILEQFLELLNACDRVNGKGKTRAHITITGGEPFLREDILDWLDLLAAHRRRFSLAILTNGILIDERLARYLGFLGPRFVQVSMDGAKETHDRIRGAGNFDQVRAGVRHLVRHRVPVIISFTAQRQNFRDFPQVFKAGLKLGAKLVWADRFVPLGQSEAMRELILSPAETREFVRSVCATRPGKFSLARLRTDVACRRALQFLYSGESPYTCTAGSTLLTVMANGDLVPCRRMPMVIGNLLHENLGDLYWHNDRLLALRRWDRVIDGCQSCIYHDLCRGGLRCLAYAIYGDANRADPGCWLTRK